MTDGVSMNSKRSRHILVVLGLTILLGGAAPGYCDGLLIDSPSEETLPYGNVPYGQSPTIIVKESQIDVLLKGARSQPSYSHSISMTEETYIIGLYKDYIRWRNMERQTEEAAKTAAICKNKLIAKVGSEALSEAEKYAPRLSEAIDVTGDHYFTFSSQRHPDQADLGNTTSFRSYNLLPLKNPVKPGTAIKPTILLPDCQ